MGTGEVDNSKFKMQKSPKFEVRSPTRPDGGLKGSTLHPVPCTMHQGPFTRRRRSSSIAFSPNGCGRRFIRYELSSIRQSLAQLCRRRPLGDLADFPEQVLRERHAFQRRTRLQPAVQLGRDVSYLNHWGHVPNLQTCGTHVQVALPAILSQRQKGHKGSLVSRKERKVREEIPAGPRHCPK